MAARAGLAPALHGLTVRCATLTLPGNEALPRHRREWPVHGSQPAGNAKRFVLGKCSFHWFSKTWHFSKTKKWQPRLVMLQLQRFQRPLRY